MERELSVDGANGGKVKTVEEMVVRFCVEMSGTVPAWLEQLKKAPESMEELQNTVHVAFARGADLVFAGMMAVVLQDKEFAKMAEDTRRHHPNRLDRGRGRKVRVRLLGGLIVWITSLYCLPRRTLFHKPEEGTPGVYADLIQFGISNGVSPGLQSRVARKVALLPSIAMAHAELKREGVELDVKTVRRVTYDCGNNLLLHRKQLLDDWRAGHMAASSELSGKRVCVQIDGGRIKIRGEMRKKQSKAEALNEDGLPLEDAPGRSKKVAKRAFSADWREPKLVTIFIHDRNGKMVSGSKATIDGTLLGPDAICELVAMHLHRLGAASAESVTFISDGAPWIWDRIDRIIELAHLKEVQTYQVLDNCHAAHHVSLAIQAKGVRAEDRFPLYRQYRTLLRNGQWQRVVAELTDEGQLDPSDNPALATQIEYLRRHGEAGRLKYAYFKGIGVPLGSGAIESTVRRVVNMRLKSNATFWKSENAEAMLQVRASVVSDRWDSQRQEVKQLMHKLAINDWTWIPNNMSCKKTESSSTTAT
jgi:hypothetical protein